MPANKSGDAFGRGIVAQTSRIVPGGKEALEQQKGERLPRRRRPHQKHKVRQRRPSSTARQSVAGWPPARLYREPIAACSAAPTFPVGYTSQSLVFSWRVAFLRTV